MSALRDHLRDYLALRRGLGFRLRGGRVLLERASAPSWSRRAPPYVTSALARWAMTPASARPTTWAGRSPSFGSSRAISRASSPQPRSPAHGSAVSAEARQPYLYSQEEIERLMAAALSLPSRQVLRPQNVSTLIGLLAVTGMRVNEALACTARTWTSRPASSRSAAASSPSRVSYRCIPRLPGAEGVRRAARCVSGQAPLPAVRTSCRPGAASSLPFGGSSGVQRDLARRGAAHATEHRGPRLHDLRHRFATETLLRWSRRAPRSTARCRPSRRISAIPTSAIRIGISPPIRSSCSMRRCAWSVAGEARYEHSDSSGAAAELLYRAPPDPATGERSYDRFLPRHVPSPVPLCAARTPQAPFGARPLRPGCRPDRESSLPFEEQRRCRARTRNARLTAIRSFFYYASFQEPGLSGHIQRVLAIPYKRQTRPIVNFLSHGEIEALLTAPDGSTWLGRRDHALLALAFQTGLRLWS